MTSTKPLTRSDTEHSVFGQPAYLPTSIIPSGKDVFRYILLYQQERKSAGQVLPNNRESYR